jgi:hypothetical protein
MPTVIAYFETNDKVAAQAARQVIVEGHNFEIDKRYSARLDSAHLCVPNIRFSMDAENRRGKFAT